MYKFFVAFSVNGKFGNCIIERKSNISSYEDIKYITNNISQMLNEENIIILNYRRILDD